MTREEAIKYLSGKKVFVKDKSKEIQEKLFSLDFIWFEKYKTVSNTDKPFLYINNSMIIECGIDLSDFYHDNEYKEISAEQILSLELTEPSYRPFKTKEECWNEMLKHQPFGWLRLDDMYINIVCVQSVDKQIELSPENLKFEEDAPINIERMFISFKRAFNEYLFADGTPFGIKGE